MTADIGFFDKLKGILKRRTHERTATFQELTIKVADGKIKVADAGEIVEALATPDKDVEALGQELQAAVETLKSRRAMGALWAKHGSTREEQAELTAKIAEEEAALQATIMAFEERVAGLSERLRTLILAEQGFERAGQQLRRTYAGPALGQLQQLGRRRQQLTAERQRLEAVASSARHQASAKRESAGDPRWTQGGINAESFLVDANRLEVLAAEAEADGAPRIAAIDRELASLAIEQARLESLLLQP